MPPEPDPKPDTSKAKGMTADKLQALALRLGTAAWCRHWLHWNYPQQDPWLMAISCLDFDGKPLREALTERGFSMVEHSGLFVYTIPRVNDDGQPCTSPL